MTTIPALDDLLDDVHVVSIPMRVRFRGITTREAMLLRGPAGWTEFSPFVEYDDAESAAWLRAAIDFGWNLSAASTTPGTTSIPVNATVPAVAPDDVAGVLARYPGCTTAKVKVAEPGTSIADDVARVSAVRRVMGTEARIRIDANALWSVDEAERALVALAPLDLEYAEQPCATVPELAELRRRIAGLGVAIAADESVRKATDPLAVARAGAADVLIVKAQPLGGITAARALVAQTGLPCVVSSALDTSVGISMGAHLAAAITAPGTACGLGTVAMFVEDIATDPLVPMDGRIDLRRVEPSPERLARLAGSPDRQAWWMDRLRRTYALVDQNQRPL